MERVDTSALDTGICLEHAGELSGGLWTWLWVAGLSLLFLSAHCTLLLLFHLLHPWLLTAGHT